MVQKVIGSKRVLREAQRKWAGKLNKCDLIELNLVRTFAKRSLAHVSVVQLDGHADSAFALKSVQKSKIKTPAARQSIFAEKQALLAAQSDFVVKLYRTFKDKRHLHFLTEYCPGGDLMRFDRSRFAEDAAKFYIACTVEALDCLHSLDIVHNDLKPGNIVLDADGYAKVIDLGLAQKIEKGRKAFSFRGTVSLVPPEVARILLKKQQGFKGRNRAVDLWALGVLLYKLLTGDYPFEDASYDNKKICAKIEQGIDSVRFPEKNFSTEAVDFVRKLCAHNPKKRMGYENIQEIREHPWFQSFDWVKLRNRELKPPVIPLIEDVTDTQNFKGTASCDLDAVEEDESDWDVDF